ncbi:MAG: EF-P lysine aminoacylase GenX [Lentisphaeria bacterium]|nr:EF-P lysine aminoacylase GenX [Lentisphaeria bacterium]
MTSKEITILRAKLYQAIRKYFDKQAFVEVDTAVRLTAPTPEDYIDAISAEGSWLRTSPEMQMKKLVAQGLDRIYQMGPCFRRGEFGRLHRSEYIMLEWYEAYGNYQSMIPFIADLFAECAKSLQVDCPSIEQWEIYTLSEAFLEHTGQSAEAAISAGKFEELLMFKVEPALNPEIPTILCDYPASQAALAKLKEGNIEVAERWELYWKGIELCNVYSELIEPVEQRLRFEQTLKLRAQEGRDCYSLDHSFLESLANMPETAGAALGVDRLLMALLDLTDIKTILPDYL